MAPQASPGQPGSGPARPNSAFMASNAPAANTHSAPAQVQQLSQATGNSSEQLGSGVVLRWKTVSSTAASEQAVAQASKLRQQAGREFAQADSSQSDTFQTGAAGIAQSSPTVAVATGRDNPLRSQVMHAAYQQSTEAAPPALPSNGAQLPNLPNSGNFAPPSFGGAQTLPPTDLADPSVDPLQSSELPPPPPSSPQGAQPFTPPQNNAGRISPDSILEDNRPTNPFPAPRDNSNSASDLGSEPELLPPPRGATDKLQPGSEDSSSELKRRNDNANSGYCNEMRARIHANPISNVSLDISPKYGAGLRAKKNPEQQRLDFASSAIVREWTDYRGYVVANGRLIDLRDDRVVIDVDGREQLIPIRDLSDVDVTYVGESWNIPERCGTGYESLRGRNFVPATVQWAASGLCHKPLYFEQVQLERYGHETGPVLQPLISTAHFFGNITLLPYKMGIHPPGECQYALGYFRPGNCAPYMMQPIPWSLRGAAAQAAVVTGGAALIP